MKEIVRIKFGSHLYGTNTHESDVDFKGVFLPEGRDIILGRVPKSINSSTGNSGSKNTKADIDCEIYSLHYFIKLACEGQTVAMDMLHAPSNMIESTSDIWASIVKERKRFYTRNLQAFVGYARRQAAKYGVKGSRLNAVKLHLDYLGMCNPDDRLSTLWEHLPVGDHMRFFENGPNGVRQYQICGKILQENQKIGYTIDILQKFYDEYGQRAKAAEENKNIDWKAVSHAMRAAIQTKEILIKNTITFPLAEAPYLLQVKKGELDYLSEVAPKLEMLMDEVESLSLKSHLPEQVDSQYWDNFIVETVQKYVL